MAIEATSFEIAHVERVTALVGEAAHRDIAGLPQRELMDAHAAVARLGRLADTLLARFAGEIEMRSSGDLPGGGLARQQGFGNAGAMVAHVTGGTQADARRAISAGLALLPHADALAGSGGSDATTIRGELGEGGMGEVRASAAPRYPAVAEAALAGDLSVDAAGLITAGLEALADCLPSVTLHALERRLVEKAKSLAAHDVRRMVAMAVARADVRGHEERELLQHQDRFIAWKEDHTGMVTLTGRLDPVTAAPIRNVIEQVVSHQFRARRDQDPTDPDKRSAGQMRADALFELCRHALGCADTQRSGVRTTIVVRMNKRDLDAGQGLGAIDGTVVPVSVGALRRLAGDAGIVPEVLGGESEVLDLGRTVRLFTRAQRVALLLLERDGGCAKCHAPPEHCEAHHIRWWENGGGSDLANGVMLCTRCHHDIHRYGWEIVVYANRVSFIPPPAVDPRREPVLGGLGAIDLDVSGLWEAPPDWSGLDGDVEALGA